MFLSYGALVDQQGTGIDAPGWYSNKVLDRLEESRNRVYSRVLNRKVYHRQPLSKERLALQKYFEPVQFYTFICGVFKSRATETTGSSVCGLYGGEGCRCGDCSAVEGESRSYLRLQSPLASLEYGWTLPVGY